MKRTRRSSQVGDVLRTELSIILQRELNDPELGFLTVMDVEVSPDLKVARVFVSSLGKPAERAGALAALRRASGRIRHLLSQRAKLRFTPELEFRIDETAERAASIDRILQKVQPKEEES